MARLGRTQPFKPVTRRVLRANQTFTSTLSESVTNTATVSRVVQHSFVEAILNSDALTTTRIRITSLLEAVTHTDLFTGKIIAKTLTEAITHTDTVLRVVSRTLSDAVTVTATVLKTASRSLLESIVNTDAIAKRPSRTLSESVTNTATVSPIRIKNSNFTETVTVTATMLRIYGKNLIESITVTSFFRALLNGSEDLWSSIVNKTSRVWTKSTRAITSWTDPDNERT